MKTNFLLTVVSAASGTSPAVAACLDRDRGLDTARIAASSRGYLDATGKDEASWFLDRRVDIRLDN